MAEMRYFSAFSPEFQRSWRSHILHGADYCCNAQSPTRMAKSPSTSAKAASTTPPTSFEAALEELEGIVQTMETGQLPLEKSLASYERGITLIQYCQTTLDSAERKLQALENGVLRQLGSAELDVANGNDADDIDNIANTDSSDSSDLF